jgi:hypothetical protein
MKEHLWWVVIGIAIGVFFSSVFWVTRSYLAQNAPRVAPQAPVAKAEPPPPPQKTAPERVMQDFGLVGAFSDDCSKLSRQVAFFVYAPLKWPQPRVYYYFKDNQRWDILEIDEADDASMITKDEIRLSIVIIVPPSGHKKGERWEEIRQRVGSAYTPVLVRNLETNIVDPQPDQPKWVHKCDDAIPASLYQ